MKKSLVALAVLGTLAGTAAAQSSVTLFGVVDLATRYNKANGNSISSLGSDGLSSSRLGVRGIEDLGGGLKAGFWLESGLSADTGTAGDTARNAFWNRRATVSLMSNDLGEVRLGRAKTSTRTLIDDFDVFGTVGLGDITKIYSTLGSGADTINRSDNQAYYALPANLGGFYGSAEVAAGEGTVGKKYGGGRLGYKAGAFNVSGAYQETSTVGSKWKWGALAGSYDFGFVKAGLIYAESKYGSRKQDIWTINGVMPVGPGSVQLSYSQSNANTAAASAGIYDAQLLSASYIYNLSKRTALYTTVSAIDNDDRGTAALGGSPKMAPGGRSGGFDVGIRHSF